MRISTITNWAYGATVLLTGLSGGAFILSAVAAADERATVERHMLLDELGEELALHSEVRSDEARLYAMRGAERHLAAFRREEQAARGREQTFDRIRAQALTPVERAAIEEAERNVDELDTIERAAIARAEAGDGDAARQLLYGPDHERAQTAVLEPVRRFRALLSTRAAAELQAARVRADGFALFARIMLGITAALFLAVLYFVLRRRVSVPLSRMAGVVMRLARQDYTVEVPQDRRRDEIGEMTQAIHVFRDNGLERDRLEAERAADRRVKDTILQMMHRLQAIDTQQELAEVVACFAPLTFPNLAGRLYVLDEAGAMLVEKGRWLDPAGSRAAFPPADCWGVRRGRPHASNQDGHDIACAHVGEATPPALCVPLNAQGDTIGLLYFEERAGVEPAYDASRLYLELMAENVGLALANLRLREQLTRLAACDSLTGLLNRRSLNEVLDRAARELPAPALACLMIDIDHFKRFNDLFGHEAGDLVLQHVGRVLRDAVGGEGEAYRFGGEEFTVLTPGDESTALELAERLRAMVHATALAHRGRTLGHVTLSIGIAAAPQDGPVGNLLVSADAALLEAKRRGRDQVVLASAPQPEPGAISMVAEDAPRWPMDEVDDNASQ